MLHRVRRLEGLMEFAEASRFVERLLEEWGPGLVRQAYRMSGNPESADDLVQEAFMALFQELRKGARIENARAWTLTVVRNLAAKKHRSRTANAECLEPGEVLDQYPACSTAGIPGNADLREMLSILSPREQEVVLLRLDCMKYREIASILGIDDSSVATHLARAIRKLQAEARERESSAVYGRSAHAQKAL